MKTLVAVTNETVGLVRAAMGGDFEEMLKAAGFMQPTGSTTGLQNYDLEPVAANLFPVITPLRNRIPRRSADGGIQANWKAFTGVNTAGINPGVSDGNRGGVVTTGTADYAAAYKQFGLEDFVTWAAKLAADKFLDLRSRSATNLLWALMIGEEALDIGGNTSLALGRGNQPSLADSTSGGALAFNTQYSVIVAPLTLDALMNGSVAGGVNGAVTRTNADASSDTYGGGTGRPSLARTITTANDASSAHSLSATTAATAGAAGYAWFWGASGSEVLGAITTINSLVITGAAAGTQTAASLGSSDNSTNSMVYDGIITQVVKSGLGYNLVMATGTAGTGTPLTADGYGGVVEIDAALQWFWDTHRVSPDTLWVASQEQRNITKKVLTGSSTGAQRFMINSNQGNITGGDLVTTYLNKFTMNGAKSLDVKLHPNLPAGTIMFDTERLPYPLPSVEAPLIKRLREDYRAQDWALRSRKYEFGVYFDGVLQNYAPFAYGVINNIGNG